MLDAELTPGARLVYLMLDEYARKADEAFPSQKTLAGRLGMSLRSVSRHITELVKTGFLKTKRETAGGGNTYQLAARDLTPTSRQIGATSRQPWRDPHANRGVSRARVPYCLNTITEEEKNPLPPLPPPMPPPPTAVVVHTAPLSEGDFRELEEAFDRHLKHHRTEPRDTVLQMVMDQALRGVFDWPKFRARHREWCARQTVAGWQYASLTFLGWIRAGYPPAPPVPIDREQQKMHNANQLAKMLRGEK